MKVSQLNLQSLLSRWEIVAAYRNFFWCIIQHKKQLRSEQSMQLVSAWILRHCLLVNGSVMVRPTFLWPIITTLTRRWITWPIRPVFFFVDQSILTFWDRRCLFSIIGILNQFLESCFRCNLFSAFVLITLVAYADVDTWHARSHRQHLQRYILYKELRVDHYEWWRNISAGNILCHSGVR